MNDLLVKQIRRRVSIPEYYRRYIDITKDLTSQPKQCCPFHQENTPSWSYSAERQKWACFGKCHIGGDVIDLHKVHRKLENREEAIKSLCMLYDIPYELQLDFSPRNIKIDEEQVEYVSLLRKLENRCKTADDWVELDEAMSYHEMTADKIARLKTVKVG